MALGAGGYSGGFGGGFAPLSGIKLRSNICYNEYKKVIIKIIAIVGPPAPMPPSMFTPSYLIGRPDSDDDTADAKSDMEVAYTSINPSITNYFSTTFKPPTTNTPSLEDILPWLKTILSENGTLTLSKGNFKLGLNETVTEQPACTATPTNTTGVCTLINNCKEIHDKLTSLQEYEKYFCPLNE